MTIVSDDTPQRRETPSLLAANLYLLVGLLVLIGSSYAAKDTNVRYVIGIAVECVLALGALLFQRIERLSIRETLRWRWPGWQPLVLSGGLAFGLWIGGVILNLMTMVILGYTTPIPPTTFPRNVLEALLLVLSTVVVAPICEEVMFRGYVQRAYERRNPWIGIVVGGVIFALYHLRFQGAFALVPVAFALGFVAWHSNSLFPGILLHAAYNGIATVLIVASSFFSMPVVGGLMMVLICTGLFMVPVALASLWGLWRTTHPPIRGALARLAGWRKWAWLVPIVVMLGIYMYSAFWEVLVGRFPETLVVEALKLEAPAAWETPTRWQYTLRGGLDQTVGTAECSILPQTESFTLTCEVSQEDFAVELPFDLPTEFDDLSVPGLSLAGNAFKSTQHVVWSRTNLAVQAIGGTRETQKAALMLTAADGAVLRVEGGNETETLSAFPAGALLDGEWPWRLSALPFDVAYGSRQPLVLIDPTGQLRIMSAFVLVEGGEPAWTPAGNFVTWKVTVTYEIDGEETALTAWYDVDAPHTLVRYDNGEVSYLLERVE